MSWRQLNYSCILCLVPELEDEDEDEDEDEVFGSGGEFTVTSLPDNCSYLIFLPIITKKKKKKLLLWIWMMKQNFWRKLGTGSGRRRQSLTFPPRWVGFATSLFKLIKVY